MGEKGDQPQEARAGEIFWVCPYCQAKTPLRVKDVKHGEPVLGNCRNKLGHGSHLVVVSVEVNYRVRVRKVEE